MMKTQVEPGAFPIVTLALDQIRPDPQNVYRHDDAEVQRLVGVMGEHGVLTAITVDAASAREEGGATSYELVGGEARLEAARALGLTSLPAILATFGSKEQRRAAAIALNAPYGHFDDAALTAMLRELTTQEYDVDLTGLEPFRVEALLEGVGGMGEVTGRDGLLSGEFPTYDEDLPTDYCCPKCGYEWSGKAR